MKQLVDELQRDALDRSVNISDLLQKALVVAKKYAMTDLVQWISLELNGYPLDLDNKLIPHYRLVYGSPMVFSLNHGWQSLDFDDQKQIHLISKRKNLHPIAILDNFISDDESSDYIIEYSPKVSMALTRIMEVPLHPALIIPRTELVRILDAVRYKILDWALELEEIISSVGKEKRDVKTITLPAIKKTIQ